MSTPYNDRKPGEPVAWRWRSTGEQYDWGLEYCDPSSDVLPDGGCVQPLVPLSDYTAEVARREAAEARVLGLEAALTAAHEFIAGEYRDARAAALDGSPFAPEARPVLDAIVAALASNKAGE